MIYGDLEHPRRALRQARRERYRPGVTYCAAASTDEATRWLRRQLEGLDGGRA